MINGPLKLEKVTSLHAITQHFLHSTLAKRLPMKEYQCSRSSDVTLTHLYWNYLQSPRLLIVVDINSLEFNFMGVDSGTHGSIVTLVSQERLLLLTNLPEHSPLDTGDVMMPSWKYQTWLFTWLTAVEPLSLTRNLTPSQCLLHQ